MTKKNKQKKIEYHNNAIMAIVGASFPCFVLVCYQITRKRRQQCIKGFTEKKKEKEKTSLCLRIEPTPDNNTLPPTCGVSNLHHTVHTGSLA